MAIKVEGLKELDRKLSMLSKSVSGATARKVMRGAMMDAASPIWKAARANANAVGIRGLDSGALAAAMGRWFKIVRPNTFMLWIGPRSRSKAGVALWTSRHGREPKGGRLRHAHMVEFGTKKDPAQPYLRPAFYQNVRRAVTIFSTKLRARIEKAARIGRVGL
jgi:HK97 gp10 family phage protein